MRIAIKRCLLCLPFTLLLAACVRPQGAVTPPPPSAPRQWQTPHVYLPLVVRAARPASAAPRITPAFTWTPSPTATPVPEPVTLNFCAALPGNALPIPESDFNGIQSTLPVEYSGRVLDLKVRLDIAHTWVGDLEVELSHAGRSVVLLKRPGKSGEAPSGCPGNGIQALFDDQAPVDASAACSETAPAIAGTVRPARPLSAFRGASLDGEWTLTVRDLSEPDRGVLTAWCLAATVER